MPYKDRKKRLAYQRQWNRAYYQKNKQKEILRVRRRKAEIATWFANLKSQLSCSACGETDSACLDFHHLDRQNKDFSLGLIKTWGWSKDRIENELKKCIVVCANCHRKLHNKVV